MLSVVEVDSCPAPSLYVTFVTYEHFDLEKNYVVESKT